MGNNQNFFESIFCITAINWIREIYIYNSPVFSHLLRFDKGERTSSLDFEAKIWIFLGLPY